jgi:hypothetical protein
MSSGHILPFSCRLLAAAKRRVGLIFCRLAFSDGTLRDGFSNSFSLAAFGDDEVQLNATCFFRA